MTDTRKRHRTPITFDPAILKWLEDNHRANGHAAVSKFANSIISEYVKSKTAPPEPEGPLTPEQEVEKTVEEIGNLTVTYHEKFEAMRSLVPKDAPKLQTLEDVKKRVDFIWAKVIDKNGFVLGDRGKVVPLSKTDVRCYELLCQLQLRKLELQKVISVAAVAGAQ